MALRLTLVMSDGRIRMSVNFKTNFRAWRDSRSLDHDCYTARRGKPERQVLQQHRADTHSDRAWCTYPRQRLASQPES